MIIRGPFTLRWGDNTIEDIESIEIEYELDSEDYVDNSGHTFQIDKSIRVGARITLLASDIASLSTVLPQYFVSDGGTLGDGNLVDNDEGAIDILTDNCTTEPQYSDLTIESCGNGGETFKLLHARTVVDGFEIGKVRKIVVKFIGESEDGKSILQLLGGDVTTDEFFQLGNDELFLLGDGENLIL